MAQMKPQTHLSCRPGAAQTFYLAEHGVLAAGVHRRIISVLHGQTSVDVESRHEVRLAGLRVLQALSDEGGAAFGQQQELLYALDGAKGTHEGTQNYELMNVSAV